MQQIKGKIKLENFNVGLHLSQHLADKLMMMMMMVMMHSFDRTYEYVQYIVDMKLDKYCGASYGTLAQESLR